MNFICSINGQSLVKFDCCNYACNMIKIHIPVAPTSYKHTYIHMFKLYASVFKWKIIFIIELWQLFCATAPVLCMAQISLKSFLIYRENSNVYALF